MVHSLTCSIFPNDEYTLSSLLLLIAQVQLNLPNASVDMFSMGKDVNFADLNNLNCTEHIEEKCTSVGIFSQSKIGTFFFSLCSG